MDTRHKDLIRRLYSEMQAGETVLGMDEDRSVGVISIVEVRRGQTYLMPVAEIRIPLVAHVANA
jgi:hypothetical protein